MRVALEKGAAHLLRLRPSRAAWAKDMPAAERAIDDVFDERLVKS